MLTAAARAGARSTEALPLAEDEAAGETSRGLDGEPPAATAQRGVPAGSSPRAARARPAVAAGAQSRDTRRDQPGPAKLVRHPRGHLVEQGSRT